MFLKPNQFGNFVIFLILIKKIFFLCLLLVLTKKKTYVDRVFIEKLTQCHYRRQKKIITLGVSVITVNVIKN